ncbi:MAG: hypothetical protein I8H68_11470 [Flavobacteriia bacterium]|nr:hypothetical protein [Flavobacteriia bacterium]MBH2023379.1 hypothetical protein [Flavobacteriales bacterium]
MKNIYLILAFAVSTFSAKAQTKEETVQTIDALYKSAFTFGQIKVVSVACENNFLVKIFSDSDTVKTDLQEVKVLRIVPHYNGEKWHIMYTGISGKGKNEEYLLGHINAEETAQKLKVSLEHLIALVKKEKL